ncbi:MAG: ABC transporter substrate-binding protein [Chthonomonadales bacterium]|nr:ABC transporter substrate-binding protein [Chthonomonadales bacterium]
MEHTRTTAETGHSGASLRALFVALLAVALGTVALWGCGKTETKPTIAVIPKGTSQSFWLAVKAGAEKAGEELGVQIHWDGPAEETDLDGQIRIVQNAVTKKVKAIVLAACDAKSLVRYVKDAQKAGIPVVTIDSGITPDISTAFLATDNVKGGAEAADALAELIGEKGKVGLLPFIKGAGSSDDRERGFCDALSKYPNIDLGDRILYSNSDVSIGLDKTKSMLTATPDLAGIFAANQGGAEGAIQALRQMGKAGKVKLVCYDASDAEIQALRDGVVQALIVQNPYRMGYEGVKTAMRAVKGETIDPRVIDTGVTKVTLENLDTPEIQELLNPVKK